MTALTCPKCASEMRSYERNRVLVDQCTGCGGLFLDRGELEKLVSAENEFYAAAPPAAVPTPQDRVDDGRHEPRYEDRRPDRRDDDRRYSERGYENRGYEGRGYESRGYDDRRYDDRGHHGKPYRKKKSFLSELFDD